MVVNLDGQEYLVTALHVLENCDESALVRMHGEWNKVSWETVVEDRTADIAVLKTDTAFGVNKLPVQHGKQPGMLYGQIGYALGFPAVLGSGKNQVVDHILEIEGRPIPAVALAVWNFQPSAEKPSQLPTSMPVFLAAR